MELQNNKEFFFEKHMVLNTFIYINEIEDLTLIDKLIESSKKELSNSTISRKTNVKADRTDFESLKFNPLFHEFLTKIKKDIYKIFPYNFLIDSAWANFYKKEDYAEEHTHLGTTAFCGILYCTDGPGPGTYFSQYDLVVKEKKGRFVLFNPLLLHSVPKFNYQSERITIAFNMGEVKKWDYENPIKVFIMQDKKNIINI